MKILVLSDSHKVLRNTSKVFEKLCKVVDAVVHLGDCYNDMVVFKKRYSRLNFYGVTGNCDFFSEANPEELTFKVGLRKIFITHGHNYGVKSNYQGIIYGALEREADVCLFGHTHQPEIFESKGVIFMNPGSITYPRDRFGPTYGILDINGNGKINVSIVELDNKVIFQL